MAWTLRHEFLFYGLFAIAILDKRLGFAVFAAWFALLVWNVFHQTPCEMLTVAAERCMAENSKSASTSPLWFLVAANVNLYFFLGMGLSFALRMNLIGRVVVASAALCVIALVGDWRFSSTYLLALTQATTFAALVSLAIWLSTKARAPTFAFWIGEISYVFYLLHMTTMLMAHGILKRLALNLPWLIEPIFALALTILASHVATRYFEKPIREWLVRNKGGRVLLQSEKAS